MEHQTVSFVSNFEFFLLAHELSHQWFGDYITCGSFKDVWLNEGFATFSEALATEKLFGNKDFTNWKSNRNNRITSLPYGSLYVDDTTNIWRIFDSRLSYDKGGMVLQMLRTQIGDSAFFHGIRSYLVDSLLINNFAFTSDLKRHFEASSGKNLSNFFNEWIYGEGYPIYQTNYLIQDNSCYLFINQTTSSESVKFYHLKIPYLLKGENKDSLIWIEPSSNYKVFKINTNFIVDQVIFNPYFDIIGKWTVDKLDLSSKDFLLYPNPTTDTLHFVSKENIGHYDWKIYGINGKVYLNNEGEGEKEITINITNLKSGNYFLEIKTSSFTKTEKFIKN
jgi:aminopeptidase N